MSIWDKILTVVSFPLIVALGLVFEVVDLVARRREEREREAAENARKAVSYFLTEFLASPERLAKTGRELQQIASNLR